MLTDEQKAVLRGFKEGKWAGTIAREERTTRKGVFRLLHEAAEALGFSSPKRALPKDVVKAAEEKGLLD